MVKIGNIFLSSFLKIEKIILYFEVWADHGDMCSIQYAGTGALKADFTRTGQRTFAGLLRDLMNALWRYYINNFSDGYRQDAVDLFLGNFPIENVDKAMDYLATDRDWKFFVILVKVFYSFP